MTLNVFRFTGLNSALALKAPVRCAASTNITLAGLQTIDGVVLQSTDTNLRVLVMGQTDSRQNGLYDSQSGNWTRCTDWDTNDDIVSGTQVFVNQGAVNQGTYVLTSADPITLGTSNITFARVTPTFASVGIGIFPAYPLDILSATADQARFRSSGANRAEIIVDNQAGGNQSNVAFLDAGTVKWQIGKQTDNSFFAFDAANNANWLTVTTGGVVTIGESGKSINIAGPTAQLGAADAAAPVAQTLQVQSVVAGTSNTAGADWTFIASKSTGSAAGGQFVWQTTPAGGAGSSQNSLQTSLTLNAAGNLIGTNSNWVIDHFGSFNCNDVQVSSNNRIVFAGDTTVRRGTAAATIQLGALDAASPVAQTLQVQSVVAGNGNVAGVNWTLKGSLSNGAGLSGDIIIQTGDTGAGSGTQNAQNTAITFKGGTAQGLAGSVVIGKAAIATNATDGFLYIPTCAGQPSGTPTGFTGRVALVWDTTNHKFWVYDTAWKGGTNPGVWT